MFHRKRESGHLIVRLIYRDGEYYIENTIPVSVIQDNFICGCRIIELLTDKNKSYSFRVSNLHKFKLLNHSTGLAGIILSK